MLGMLRLGKWMQSLRKCAGHTLVVWNHHGETAKLAAQHSYFGACCVDPNGSFILAAEGNMVYVLQLQSSAAGQLMQSTLQAHAVDDNGSDRSESSTIRSHCAPGQRHLAYQRSYACKLAQLTALTVPEKEHIDRLSLSHHGRVLLATTASNTAYAWQLGHDTLPGLSSLKPVQLALPEPMDEGLSDFATAGNSNRLSQAGLRFAALVDTVRRTSLMQASAPGRESGSFRASRCSLHCSTHLLGLSGASL